MTRIELNKKDLHQSLFLSVNPNHFYGLSPKREGLEQLLYYFASHKFMLVSLMLIVYVISIIYGYFLLDATRFWINIAVIIAQGILHRKNLCNSINKEEDIKVSVKVEKIRMVISTLLMSCRFYALSCNKVLLVPSIFGEALKSLQNVLVGYANQFSVNLQFHIDSDLNLLVVESNRSRLHQVISNLLSKLQSQRELSSILSFLTQI